MVEVTRADAATRNFRVWQDLVGVASVWIEKCRRELDNSRLHLRELSRHRLGQIVVLSRVLLQFI